MNRSLVQLRLFLAMLIFSLAPVLGIGSAVAAPSPCREAGIHLPAGDTVGWPALGTSRPCSDPAGCPAAMPSQSCYGSGSPAVLAGAPESGVVFMRPTWTFVPANALAGIVPRAMRRPPRVAARHRAPGAS